MSEIQMASTGEVVMNETSRVANSRRQPAGLPILFLTEMWERFGFYVVQGLLVLYLTQHLGMSDTQSYQISGAFTAFVYISPIIGGYIADKIIGYRAAVVTGNILFILGYGLLGLLGQGFLYLCLAIIILGNGFFKPNIATLLGTLYDKVDARREAGFTIYYMGINLGVILSTLSSGFVKDWLGWSAGFSLAAVGLIVGLLTFIIGIKKMAGHGLPPPKQQFNSVWLSVLHSRAAVIFGSIIAIPLVAFLLRSNTFSSIALILAAIALLVGIIALALKQPELQSRNRILALLVLNIITVAFWAVFFQIFFSVNLFIDRNVDRVIFGLQIPTVAFISFESIFILLTGPFLARLWLRLHYRNKNISTPVKFFWGFVIVGIGFLLLAASAYFHNAAGLTHPLWIPVSYLFLTLGEMLVSPIIISAVTLLSPPQWVGLMMGVYLIGIGYGGKVGGMIASLSSIPADVTSPVAQSHYYSNAFFQYALMSLLVAVVVLSLTPLLKRWIGKVEYSS